MKKKRSRRYYINQIPKHHKDLKYGSLDDAFEDYRKYLKSISDYFIGDMRLKEEYLDLYNILIGVELNDKEINSITKTFYDELAESFNDKLSSDDYELD
ncbi:hypothetical protein AGMMS50212_14360 [Spirochaetia bacterium]|nr:hypothetical protein AGMMS50212_14360 [Spirochaetia bacterium]